MHSFRVFLRDRWIRTRLTEPPGGTAFRALPPGDLTSAISASWCDTIGDCGKSRRVFSPTSMICGSGRSTHWKLKRVQTHLAICYMAFCCLQHVRYRLCWLGHEMSADATCRELNALQVSFLVESPGQGQYGMPSRVSTDARRIYRSVGLSWNERSFAVSATGRRRKPPTPPAHWPVGLK